jgi:DNA-binding response OmpR family regulator
MALILVVEDEVNVSSFLKRGLEEEGHTVSVAFDGTVGLNLSLTNDFDLILLDLILPKMNGIEICERIRKDIGYTVPIIMLTAISSSDDIVNGLNNGADDYITKPFKFKELSARINALLRRKNKSKLSKSINYADLFIDTESKTVTRAEKEIQLTSKEYRLLEYLLMNSRKVLSRTTILDNVWENSMDVTTSVVDVYINYLRNKIDRDFDPKLIYTVVGMGYVLK